MQVSRHNAELKVIKQTVSTCVKRFNPVKAPAPQQKRKVRKLYVEADEDHLSVRGRRGAQARLIYVHDGIEASVKNPDVGCSAEGHVSHILAARMSLAVSLKGIFRIEVKIYKEMYNKRLISEPFLVDLRQLAEVDELEHDF